MGETLAVADIGASVGYLLGLLVLSGLGLLLLILGIRRSRSQQPPQVAPLYWQPGPPGCPPQGDPPPPPPKKFGGTALIIVGAVLLVLGLVGGGLAALGALHESTPARAQTSAGSRPSAAGTASGLQVGECITGRQYASANMAPVSTDCTLADAVYELASHGSGPMATCPDGQREKSGYAVLLNNSRILCFVLNVAEGECFQIDPAVQLFSPTDCADPVANSKIGTIIEGSSDLGLCPEGARGAAFPVPKRTYCVVPPS